MWRPIHSHELLVVWHGGIFIEIKYLHIAHLHYAHLAVLKENKTVSVGQKGWDIGSKEALASTVDTNYEGAPLPYGE